MEYLTLLILSYITLLFLSFLFNKRLSKTGKILHRCLYYIPCCFYYSYILFVYLAIFLVMYSLNAFWKSRIFFRPMKMVNCPIGEENRISTLLSPLDLLFQVSDEYFVSVDAMCVIECPVLYLCQSVTFLLNFGRLAIIIRRSRCKYYFYF